MMMGIISLWRNVVLAQYRAHNLHEYFGMHMDDLLVIGLPGPSMTEEPTFHLGCGYEKEQVNNEVKRVQTIDKPAQVTNLSFIY